MFAVIKTGGKQYKVAVGDIIEIEKIEAAQGSSVDIKDVLMIHDAGNSKFGSPMIGGAKVTAEVIAQKKGDKIIVFKKKRRHNYRRKKGHRQFVTTLKISRISAAG